jgi:hypothetical protein
VESVLCEAIKGVDVHASYNSHRLPFWGTKSHTIQLRSNTGPALLRETNSNSSRCAALAATPYQRIPVCTRLDFHRVLGSTHPSRYWDAVASTS